MKDGETLATGAARFLVFKAGLARRVGDDGTGAAVRTRAKAEAGARRSSEAKEVRGLEERVQLGFG
jgi:hypothetical protein